MLLLNCPWFISDLLILRYPPTWQGVVHFSVLGRRRNREAARSINISFLNHPGLDWAGWAFDAGTSQLIGWGAVVEAREAVCWVQVCSESIRFIEESPLETKLSILNDLWCKKVKIPDYSFRLRAFPTLIWSLWVLVMLPLVFHLLTPSLLT